MQSTTLVTQQVISEIPPNTAMRNPHGSAAPSPKAFPWTLINFALDGALFVNFVVLCWVAALTQFVFPHGATGASWRLLGASLDGWRNLQFGLLSLLGIGILVHIMLHWTWICGVFESRLLLSKSKRRFVNNDGSRTLIGVILLATTLLLMGVALGAAAYLMRRVD